MTFNKRPRFFSTSATCIQEGLLAELYLDINEQEIIEQAYYQISNAPHFIPLFEQLCKNTIGLSIFEAYSVSTQIESEEETEQLLNIPLLLLFRALDDYRGLDSFYFAEIEQRRKQKLICRCFGVYEEDIAKLLRENRELLLADLKRETPASSLCGACTEDLEDLYFEVRSDYPPTLTEKVKVKRIKGHSPIQWIKKIHMCLEEFKIICPKEFSHLQFEIVYYGDLKVTLNYRKQGDQQLFKAELLLTQFLQSSVDKDLLVLFN